MSRSTAALVGATLLLASGCGPSGDLPRTYPAGGSVVYKGGTPMKGGAVQLHTSADPLLRVFGTTGDDGTFKLETMKDRARSSGAPEGEYEVTVQPPLQGEHRGVPPIKLPRTYKVEPKENQFKIELDVLPPRS